MRPSAQGVALDCSKTHDPISNSVRARVKSVITLPDQKTMVIFTLYRDLAGLLTIVSDDGRGWAGAYWSSSLFVTDAWQIGRRRKTELCRPTRAWARRVEWPEPIARWSRTAGDLVVLDDLPGHHAERYLGIKYDPIRWQHLTSDAFAVAIRAATSCPLTAATAAEALVRAEIHQLACFSARDVSLLTGHEDARVRQAAGVIGPRPVRLVAR
jgi:hypothetical protein